VKCLERYEDLDIIYKKPSEDDDDLAKSSVHKAKDAETPTKPMFRMPDKLYVI
jgi:hypothetical protein